MFNSKELSFFQTNYFSNFIYQNSVIEVCSRNTEHWWQILRMDMPRATMVVVRHRYPGVKRSN